MPFGWGANPNLAEIAAAAQARMSHQCLSAGGLIQTEVIRLANLIDWMASPMPFGWGANPNLRFGLVGLQSLPVRHQCLSAGGLIQTVGGHVHKGRFRYESPMPFGWGANPNDR